jgi:pilus assembly protein CpaC
LFIHRPTPRESRKITEVIMKTNCATMTPAHPSKRTDARPQTRRWFTPRRWALLSGAALAAGFGLYQLQSPATELPSFGFAPAPTPAAVVTTPVATVEAPATQPVEAPMMSALFVEQPVPQLAIDPHNDYAFSEALKVVGFRWSNPKPVEPAQATAKAPADPFAPTDAAPASTSIPPVAESTLADSKAVTPSTAVDAAKLVAAGLNGEGKLQLAIGRQGIVKTTVKISRVSIGNAEIADVLTTSVDSLLVTAKKTGATQIIVWDDGGRSEIIEVSVNTDLAGLTEQMRKSLPGTPVDIAEANGAIVLRGRVQSAQQAQQAQLLAEQFGKVVNFIEIAGGQRISVKVQFAEVSRSVQNDLSINWGFSDGRNVFGSRVGGLGTGGGYAFERGNGISGILTPDPTSTVSLFGRGLVGVNEFSYLIDALKTNNLMRMLAQPYITTNSGEAGEIFAGGEFPVPVPSDSGGSPTIDYREFGIRLKCTPVALGNGNILMKVEYEVSDLDFSSAVNVLGVQVPGLRKRSGSQTIELAEGQTLPLGGLFDSQTVMSVSKVPGLGDIPYIGALFRSTSFQRRESELVVMITPDLAGAFNPDEIPAMPGADWRNPSDAEQYFHGDIGGDAQADQQRDLFKKPSERGATVNDPGTSKVVADAGPSDPKGYAYFSPLSKQATEPAATANSSRPGSAPPLFLGEAGYAPVESPKPGTASIRE